MRLVSRAGQPYAGWLPEAGVTTAQILIGFGLTVFGSQVLASRLRIPALLQAARVESHLLSRSVKIHPCILLSAAGEADDAVNAYDQAAH